MILNLVYYECPMLCTLELNDGADPGRSRSTSQEFAIVTVSIDPGETPGLASAKKKRYLALSDRGREGWHFLTGDEPSIKGWLGRRLPLCLRSKQIICAAKLMIDLRGIRAFIFTGSIIRPETSGWAHGGIAGKIGRLSTGSSCSVPLDPTGSITWS